MGWTIVGIICLVVAFLLYVRDQADIELPCLLVILAICLFAIAFIVNQSNNEEKACIDRGGEVVHYGRLGEGVDCINVPK